MNFVIKNILLIILISLITQQTYGQAALVSSSGYGYPWGSLDYPTCMDNAFGAGNWDALDFQTVNAATLFSNAYSIIYLEGSDFGALDFAAFVTANQALMEDWVTAGGLLYINSAPNVGGNISIGFGGVEILADPYGYGYGYGYGTFTDCVDIAPDIAGNCLITDSPFDITDAFPICGNFFGHAFISGPGIIPILVNDVTGDPVLVEFPFGAGNVVAGGITAPIFHTPLVEAKQLLENTITNVGCSSCGPDYTITPNCVLGDEDNFYVEIQVNDPGENPSGYIVNGGVFPDLPVNGTLTIGPFPNGTANITFEGIDDPTCIVNNAIDFDCSCEPLTVEAIDDGLICSGESFELNTTLGDVIPGGFQGYIVTSDPAGSCTAVPDGPVTEVGLFDDDFAGPIPLGFSFDFWENTYTDFYIGSNGYVTFGSGSFDLGGDPIPSQNDPNNIIALFWTDLFPAAGYYYYNGGTVSYFTSNINGQTCMVVEFDMIQYCCFNYYGPTITGQMIMCPDGTITINCIDCQTYFGVPTSGIENADGTAGAFDPTLTNGQYTSGGSYMACTTFTPDITEPTPCNFLYWVTDLNDPTGTIVSTDQTFTVNPTSTTTYYAIVECEDGIQCVDETTVTIDADCCTDEIMGQVIAPFECDLSGITVVVSIINEDGSETIVDTAITDAAGNYVLDGDWTCGDYSAMLMLPLPDCYADAAGNTGPVGPIMFTVDGDGVADGAIFAVNAEIPTLSQWGLIILALLLMNFGAIVLVRENQLKAKSIV